uniref:Uncharacterized protein n=1 Tax=Anguilla anguilla TaxID=7936 RepID=A0A0E9U2J2_ANGAN
MHLLLNKMWNLAMCVSEAVWDCVYCTKDTYTKLLLLLLHYRCNFM